LQLRHLFGVAVLALQGDQLLGQLPGVGEKLVQRRIEKADGHGQTVHDLEDLFDVAPLQGLEFRERLLGGVLVLREDHAVHHLKPSVLHEHMLRQAQTYPLGAELPGLLSVVRSIGVRPDLERAQLVGPGEDPLEVLGELGLYEWNLALDHPAAAPLDGGTVPSLERLAVHAELFGV
jgi:hypothetical protein